MSASGGLSDVEEKLLDLSWAGNLVGIQGLLEQHEDIRIDCKDRRGQTPVHWAVVWRRDDCLKFLLERGADPNSTDIHGMYVLADAASRGTPESVRLLLEHGADPYVYYQPSRPCGSSDGLLWTAKHRLAGDEHEPELEREEIVAMIEEAIRPGIQNGDEKGQCHGCGEVLTGMNHSIREGGYHYDCKPCLRCGKTDSGNGLNSS